MSLFNSKNINVPENFGLNVLKTFFSKSAYTPFVTIVNLEKLFLLNAFKFSELIDEQTKL